MSLEIENFGISDEALDNFREFMEIVTAMELPIYSNLGHQCPVCLETLYRPHSTEPCGHIFCETCLRRLSQAAVENSRQIMERATTACCMPSFLYFNLKSLDQALTIKCPICRTIIQGCCFNEGKYLNDKYQSAQKFKTFKSNSGASTF